jgi:hypothetical protein
MIPQGHSHRYRPEVSTNDKIRIQMHCYLNIHQRLCPLFINLVLKHKLNVRRAGFHGIHEQKRDFLRCESLFADDVIDYRFGLVFGGGSELVLRRGKLCDSEGVGGCALVKNFRVCPVLLWGKEGNCRGLGLGTLNDDLTKLDYLLYFALK